MMMPSNGFLRRMYRLSIDSIEVQCRLDYKKEAERNYLDRTSVADSFKAVIAEGDACIHRLQNTGDSLL